EIGRPSRRSHPRTAETVGRSLLWLFWRCRSSIRYPMRGDLLRMLSSRLKEMRVSRRYGFDTHPDNRRKGENKSQSHCTHSGLNEVSIPACHIRRACELETLTLTTPTLTNHLRTRLVAAVPPLPLAASERFW